MLAEKLTQISSHRCEASRSSPSAQRELVEYRIKAPQQIIVGDDSEKVTMAVMRAGAKCGFARGEEYDAGAKFQ